MRPRIGVIALLIAISATPTLAQSPDSARSNARRISITWTETPIRDVLMAFAVFSGKSIVSGESVTGTVTADINDQPWDVALRTILASRGLVAVENEYGIISVDGIADLGARESIEPLVTRSYRISYVTASEIQATLAPLLSDRGSVSVSASTNTVVVSDIARVHRSISGLVRAP